MAGHDRAADWWAVGVLLYEMAMGAVPFCYFLGEPNFDIDPTAMYANIVNSSYTLHLPSTLDEDFVDLIVKLLTREPMHRLGRLTGG